jgi:hypothetical protein
MAILTLSNLGSLGIIRDRPAHELEPEAFSDGQNVRFTDTFVEKIEGHQRVLEDNNPLGTLPYWNLEWVTPIEYYWIYAGTTKIYRTDGDTHANITRAAGSYNATATSRWSGGVLGGVPIINNNSGSDYPQQWDGSVNRMKDLDNWPADNYCGFIRSFREFLIAGNITDASGNYPQLLRWSHPATAGSVPSSWDITDDTKLTGERPFSEGGGALLDSLSLGDFNIVYLEQAVWSMQLVQANSVFAFRRIFDTIGILSGDCATEFMRRHFVVGFGDMYVHNGQTMESVVNAKLRRWFYSNLHPDYYKRTFVVTNKIKNEIWVCFPSQDSLGLCNMALIWNWVDNTWAVRDLQEFSYGAYGVITAVENDIIDDQEQIIDDDDQVINASAFNPGYSKILMCSPSPIRLYEMDVTTRFAGVKFTSYVERTGLAIVGRDRFGNWKTDPKSKKFVRRVYPKLDSDFTVEVYIGGQDNLNDAVTWTSVTEFNPRTDTHIDCRVQFTYIAYRIESHDGQYWQFYGIDFDLDVVGRAVR